MTSYFSVFARAWLIVSLTASNVRLVSDGRYLAAFCTGGALSAVWWANTGIAAHNTRRGMWLAYALGAACGTVTGMALAR